MTVINILLWFLIRKVCYNANAIVGSAYLIRLKPFILCFEISNLLHKSLIHLCFTVFTLFTVPVMNSHLTYSLTAQEFAILFIHILLVPPKKQVQASNIKTTYFWGLDITCTHTCLSTVTFCYANCFVSIAGHWWLWTELWPATCSDGLVGNHGCPTVHVQWPPQHPSRITGTSVK